MTTTGVCGLEKADGILKGLWQRKPVPNQPQRDSIYEQLAAAVGLLDKLGIRYHLIAGSMLGLARNGGLIPWDDDVDLAIHVPRSTSR